ncbi:glycosyltransferase family 2 protein [Pedobacter sp. BS3]|uniref:glycosyltransferase family 2 protein n=1 Tax=Pedobacter sp. BS3 TaxID=2567937 RepID=UPI0011EC7590|nr:glycosyltransferase family 2 protein [Pedobacter sp. BS3]TZF84764.1 glycosyltransferase family 2 protein [Pedobacter sp. BS3]
MKIIFWLSIIIIVYTFIGYGFVLYLFMKIRQLFKGKRPVPHADHNLLPGCTLVVAAYNEQDFITEKIANTLALNYPKDKLQLLFITDGSTDKTPEIIAQYPQITLMHSPERKGKIAAVHRAVEQVTTEVVVFTDANTFLNTDALIHICRHYQDKQVGAVAGEKRIFSGEEADASSAGEGFYWKYESKLKQWDSELYSVVGAAGELFSVRTELYQPVSAAAIIDDFMISMLIAQKGYRIVYEPDAYAIETASENIPEELKRKIRIAAGGMQSIIWLKSLLNIFKYGMLSFQYISHRVLRWTITPFLLILAFLLNLFIVLSFPEPVYNILFAGQVLFYLLAVLGYLLESRHLRIKILFIPYYFCMMNYAVLAGIFRYFNKQQSAAWEKSKRKM